MPKKSQVIYRKEQERIFIFQELECILSLLILVKTWYRKNKQISNSAKQNKELRHGSQYK